MREHTVTVSLSADELAAFEAVAKRHGLPVEAMVRHVVRRESKWIAPATSSAHAIWRHGKLHEIDKARESLGTAADL
jgi:hypothetical protein